MGEKRKRAALVESLVAAERVPTGTQQIYIYSTGLSDLGMVSVVS